MINHCEYCHRDYGSGKIHNCVEKRVAKQITRDKEQFRLGVLVGISLGLLTFVTTRLIVLMYIWIAI
tara:strand:- start:4314 stop:4514 length:201 start_codon:yes stop_codon:yes gene_type:complete